MPPCCPKCSPIRSSLTKTRCAPPIRTGSPNSCSPSGGWSNGWSSRTRPMPPPPRRASTRATTFEQVVAERGLALADIDLGEQARDDLGAAGDAIFALDEPGVVGPLPSDLGPALYRMNAILVGPGNPVRGGARGVVRRTGDRRRPARDRRPDRGAGRCPRGGRHARGSGVGTGLAAWHTRLCRRRRRADRGLRGVPQGRRYREGGRFPRTRATRGWRCRGASAR